MVVYIASPYATSGDKRTNTMNQMLVASKLIKEGFSAIWPLSCHFLHTMTETGKGITEEQWLSVDKELVEKCDALIRLPGESRGADMEIEWAKEAGIPVWYGLQAFLKWNDPDGSWKNPLTSDDSLKHDGYEWEGQRTLGDTSDYMEWIRRGADEGWP